MLTKQGQSLRRVGVPVVLKVCGVALALCLMVPTSVAAQANAFPTDSDVATYRDTVESVFMKDRGGTTSRGEQSYAACVMCHTWQTSVRFSLETPESENGWTTDQSRRNLDVVGQLVNTANPESSRLLLKPLSTDAGGLPHTGGTFWQSTDDPEYGCLLYTSPSPRDRGCSRMPSSA